MTKEFLILVGRSLKKVNLVTKFTRTSFVALSQPPPQWTRFFFSYPQAQMPFTPSGSEPASSSDSSETALQKAFLSPRVAPHQKFEGYQK